MTQNAEAASELLKAIASPSRLLLLCALAEGEKSVSELTETLGMRQATVSQHLARLRQEGLVATRRDAQSVYYRIADRTAHEIIGILYRRFCEP
ncbi:ArsR/SmtB family transcription factor [Amphiplicatus metriothermophilus]|nr:metalloregulator ArsR/SmtB family transcription factor [Amphiplicatus metriothermophilus]MBB5518448.1 ArsR family transcriptional regulator [Amphiplicatus metriothermophilus]